MGCATATIKYTVFLFNTLCAILGIGTIVVTSLNLSNFKDEARVVFIFLIVFSSIVVLVSFFGCCGAIRANSCLTWIYAVFLMLLFIGSGVLHFGALSHLDGETDARETINKAWAMQLNGTDGMSFYQTTLPCCGKNNSTDYTNANLTIPSSCYKNNNVTEIYPDGCLSKLTAVFEAGIRWINILSWSMLSIECIGFIAACILAITFRNQQRRFRY